MSEDPSRIGDLLGAVTGKLGVRDAAKTGAIWAQWIDLVGEAVAAHAEPTSLKEGVLRIRADSPVWATEIGFLADDIASRINGALGSDVVGEIRVWTGPRKNRTEQRVARGVTTETGSRGSKKSRTADPEEALSRAREAWKNSRRKGPKRPPSSTRENSEKPW